MASRGASPRVEPAHGFLYDPNGLQVAPTTDRVEEPAGTGFKLPEECFQPEARRGIFRLIHRACISSMGTTWHRKDDRSSRCHAWLD